MTSRFEVSPTPIAGVSVVRRKPLSDKRGQFSRLFCDDTFMDLGLFSTVRQINQSSTLLRGTVRGLHFQHPPHAEGKLITCLKGEVFDVAVDLRRASPTFLRWYGQILSDENLESLHIPPGCAHGFQTLADDCELLYLHSSPYRPDAEGGLNPIDSAVAISWPLPVADMSDRDRNQVHITAAFKGLDI